MEAERGKEVYAVQLGGQGGPLGNGSMYRKDLSGAIGFVPMGGYGREPPLGRGDKMSKGPKERHLRAERMLKWVEERTEGMRSEWC